MGMSDVMRAKRHALGMSQVRLAEIVGVNVRQIARYEGGEQQPVLSVAAAIANALDVSLSELAGQDNPDADLRGLWWAGWQTVRDGEPWIGIQEVRANQHGQTVRLSADRSRPVDQGGYGWRGELRIWDREALIGWYRGSEGGVRSKGTIYFALHPQGTHAHGRWVGLSYDGAVITGWASLARSEDHARAIIEELQAESST